MSEAAQALRLFETGGPPAGQGASIVRIGPRADPASPQDNAFASLIAPDPGEAGEAAAPIAPEGPPAGKPFAGLGTGLSGTGLVPVPPSGVSDGDSGAPASDAAQAAPVPDTGGEIAATGPEGEVPAGQPAASDPEAAPPAQPAPAAEAGTADTPPAPPGTAGTGTSGEAGSGETAPARPPTGDASLTPGKTDTSDASSDGDSDGEDADAAALDTAGDPAAAKAASISASEPAPAPAPQPPDPARPGASAGPLAPAGPARPGAPAEPLRPVGPRSSPAPAGDGAAGTRPTMGEAAQPAAPAGTGNGDASAGDGEADGNGDGVRAPAAPARQVLASGADGVRAFARMLGNEIGERPGPRPALPQTMAEQPVFASPHGTAQAVVRAALQPAGDVHLPVRTIAVHMAQRVADGDHEFRIRLDPPDLGRVDVRMEIGRDGKLTAHLSADRPDTLDALQRDARALERALQTAGLDVEDGALSFELREHAGQGNGGAAGERGHSEEATGEEAGEDDAVRRIVSLNALDIRV